MVFIVISSYSQCKFKIMKIDKGKIKVLNIELIISLISLIIAIWSVFLTQKIAVTDRKAQVFQDTIVYLDKLSFRSISPNFGDTLTKDVDDEWIKKEILVAVELKTRLNLFDDKKANLFWEIVEEIYIENHYFNYDKYFNLKMEIKDELGK